MCERFRRRANKRLWHRRATVPAARFPCAPVRDRLIANFSRGRSSMLRREFITGIGSTAAWPLAARAQQGDRVRRIGVLMWLDENDPGAKSDLSAFTQALAGMGWTEGRNMRMDLRWYGDDTDRIRALAQELVGLQPDVILASGGATGAL